MKRLNSLLLVCTMVFVLTSSESLAQCSVNAGSDATVYAGYPALACATLTAVPTGTAPFAYLWSNGATTASITVCNTVTTVYTVTVTDFNGCISTDNVTVNVTDVRCGNNGKKVLICHVPKGNPGNAHTICISSRAVAAHLAHGDHLGDCLPPPPPCNVDLGSDASFCSGGSHLLDAGAGFTSYLWSDSSTAQTLTVTTSGTYWVQASDSVRNCTVSDTVNILVTNAPLISIVTDSLPDSLGCRNITASASGGTSPYSFSWSTGDSTAIIQVCDTVTMTYVLTVVDSNGCSSSDSVTVTPITPCSVNLGPDASFCSGDTLVLDAGAGFTSYLWSNSSTGQTLNVTVGGSYWVLATDTNLGCTATDTIQVVRFNSPIATAIADSIPDSLGCRNIIAFVSSGAPPFTYSWSTGDTIATIHVCDTVQTTYVLTVVDTNGCSSTDSVTVTPITPCLVNLGTDASFCAGDSLVLDAGAGFTSYMWSDSSTAQTLTVSSTGTYWVQATDTVLACIVSDTIEVVVFDSPVVLAVADTLADSLGCRNITGSVTGGTAPFIFSWSTGDTIPMIHVCDTITMTYILTVTDSNGCSSSDSVTVIPKVICEVNLGADASFCSGDSLVLDAGSGWTSYLWSDSSTARTLTVTTNGTYWVLTDDSVFGCTASDTIQIVVFNPLVVSVVADSLPDSLGCRNITGSVTGGSPPYIYSWNTGGAIPVIHVCDSVTMTYVLTVVDTNGCSSSDSVTVIPPCEVSLGPDSSFCSGDSLVLDAGSDFHSFLWSDSTTAQTLTVTQSGTYWVQATDTTTGCVASDTVDVIVFDAPVALAVADTIPDSLGCVNITGSFTGGTAPFTYSWSSDDTSFSDTSLVINVCDSLTITYMFTVIDSNGCSSTASVILNDTGSRPIQIVGRGIMSIRPNPFMDYTRIYFKLMESGPVTVELFDLKGNRIAVLFQGNAIQDIPYTLDFTRSDLIEAIYLVRLTKPDGSTLNSKMVLFKY